MKFHNPKVSALDLSPGFKCEWMGHFWAKALRLLKSCKRTSNDDSKAELAGGSVQLVTTMEKWEKETSEANKAGKIVVVNFSASWCGPCRQIKAAYCELADKYASVLFLTVDVDELTELCSTWDVNATPMFFFLKEGRQLDKHVGANKEELQKKVAAICGSTSTTASPH